MSDTSPSCFQCGDPFETDANGVTYHVTVDGESNHDQDADHVPYGDLVGWKDGLAKAAESNEDGWKMCEGCGCFCSKHCNCTTTRVGCLDCGCDVDAARSHAAGTASYDEYVWDTTLDKIEAEGAAAYSRNDPRAPSLNPLVRDIIAKENFVVGDPRSKELLRAFTRGYDAQSEETTKDLMKNLNGDNTFPVTETIVSLNDYGNAEDGGFIELDGIDGVRPEGSLAAIPAETLVKFTYNTHKRPVKVQKFLWRDKRWGEELNVNRGIGKSILNEVEALPPQQREIPRHAAETYGKCTNSCALCGRPLTDDTSRSRGVGSKCASGKGWN